MHGSRVVESSARNTKIEAGNTKGGKNHCTVDLLFDWFGISSVTTDCFYLQNGLIQTCQTGGKWYSDTSPFSIPWLRVRILPVASAESKWREYWTTGLLPFPVSGIVGVEIRQMRVPPVIQSGSTPFVILDCDYDLSEMEGTQVTLLAGSGRTWRAPILTHKY